MASHNSATNANNVQPLNLAAAVVELTQHYGVPEQVSAWEDLGGRPTVPFDERTLYLPAAELYVADTRKGDINRGLGELGLISLVPKHIERFSQAKQLDYAAALLNYETQLASRTRTLPLDGQIEGENFQRMYPKADQAWAVQYAEQLRELRTILTESQVFAAIKDILDKNQAQVYKKKHVLQDPHTIAVHFDGYNQPSVVRVKPNNGRTKAA